MFFEFGPKNDSQDHDTLVASGAVHLAILRGIPVSL